MPCCFFWLKYSYQIDKMMMMMMMMMMINFLWIFSEFSLNFLLSIFFLNGDQLKQIITATGSIHVDVGRWYDSHSSCKLSPALTHLDCSPCKSPTCPTCSSFLFVCFGFVFQRVLANTFFLGSRFSETCSVIVLWICLFVYLFVGLCVHVITITSEPFKLESWKCVGWVFV